MLEILQNRKNKIIIIGPSSSGKSTLINQWISKGFLKKKDICFAYEYSWLKKINKRIFHYNLLRSHDDGFNLSSDKLLNKLLEIKPLFVFILFIEKDEVERRILKRKFNEYDILNKKEPYQTGKRIAISKKCDYPKIYKSLIELLDKKEVKYTILNSNDFDYKKITYDKIQ